MIYVKSVLAGVVALFVTCVLSALIYVWVVVLPLARSTGMSIGLDVRCVLTRPFFWPIALLAFAIGFYWEFRGATP